MKKMNNKGFAISTMLYGLLILIVLIILMIISIMAFNRKNSREFSEQIVNELEKVPEKEIEFQIGDYVSMTPANTSFTTESSMTGSTEITTFDLSELNLWRVIRINDDNTVDAVSEYVSSVKVWFKGMRGYQNYIGYLNTIAHQYENPNYTLGSRHMGYDGSQTEYITDTTVLTSTIAPQTEDTSSSNVTVITEKKGLGDMGYEMDYNLVNQVYGTLVATTVGTKTETSYFLASRVYSLSYYSSTTWYFYPRIISSWGRLGYDNLYSHLNISFSGYDCPYSVRPIVILKSGLKTSSGDGSIEKPYVLS